jgi:hypothetical protein
MKEEFITFTDDISDHKSALVSKEVFKQLLHDSPIAFIVRHTTYMHALKEEKILKIQKSSDMF